MARVKKFIVATLVCLGLFGPMLACNGAEGALSATQAGYDAAGKVAPINTPTSGCVINCH